MKYSESNKPIVCMQTNSTCYKKTIKFTPRGVLWHSTGANNPNISRYVQPLETDENYQEMIDLLGKNRYGNDWNHKERQAGMNFFIGKLADGTVAAVQTMPCNFAPWGCGSGSKGSLNNTHLQFEICEDDLSSEVYFWSVYKEACEVTAYLCSLYGLDPLGTFVYKGVTVPVITTHAESHKLGLGSNHGDPLKWLKKYGKTMADVRKDVAAIMRGNDQPEAPEPTPQGNVVSLRSLYEGNQGEDVKALQILLNGMSCSCGNADGIFGPKTKKATEKFQKKHNLPGTGVADIPTWSKLLGVT